jgi:hypothetical protein
MLSVVRDDPVCFTRRGCSINPDISTGVARSALVAVVATMIVFAVMIFVFECAE